MLYRQLASALAIGVAVAASGVSYADDPSGAQHGFSAFAPPKDERGRVELGFASSPVPRDELNMRGRDPNLVGLGAYLVSAGDCSGCHSFPRTLRKGGTTGNMSGQGSNPQYGDPFEPPSPDGNGSCLPGSTSFPCTQESADEGPIKANFNKKHFMAGGRCFGSIQARNLTPDNTGRPRGLSEGEFIQEMRTGIDLSCQHTRDGNPPLYGGPQGQPDGVCGLPRTAPPGYDPNKLMVMPWVVFHNMSDTDLRAIYAYLSSLPQATACNTAADGCAGPPGIGSGRAAGLTSGRYAYAPTDECPNPPPPQ